MFSIVRVSTYPVERSIAFCLIKREGEGEGGGEGREEEGEGEKGGGRRGKELVVGWWLDGGGFSCWLGCGDLEGGKGRLEFKRNDTKKKEKRKKKEKEKKKKRKEKKKKNSLETCSAILDKTTFISISL